MSARPRPSAETHKRELLTWLRTRASYGQGTPSDRAIAGRLGLRTTDDVLVLVKALVDDGAVEVVQQGIQRQLVLTDPPTPFGTQPISREAREAANAANPPPPMEPVAVRGKPAPINLLPPRDVFAGFHAPIAAPASVPAAPIARPEEPVMPNPVAVADRQQVKINCTLNDHRLIAQRAQEDATSMGGWCLKAVRAQLLATMPETASKPAGKPRLSARVIRVANADERDFWAAISTMIELGATALAAEQKAGR